MENLSASQLRELAQQNKRPSAEQLPDYTYEEECVAEFIRQFTELAKQGYGSCTIGVDTSLQNFGHSDGFYNHYYGGVVVQKLTQLGYVFKQLCDHMDMVDYLVVWDGDLPKYTDDKLTGNGLGIV